MRWIDKETLEATRKEIHNRLSLKKALQEESKKQFEKTVETPQPVRLVINNSPSIIQRSLREIDVYIPCYGFKKEEISVSYVDSNKNVVLVKFASIEKMGLTLVASHVTLDFTKGQLMHFDIDYSRGGVSFEDGIMRIPLKRELELKKKPTLEILVK